MIVTGTLLAFFRPEAPSAASERTLTFAERVAYQRAIEEVYWRHRIWPRERADSKPTLDAVTSQAQIEVKVQDYLCKSQELEDHWHQPVTAEQLQAEMDRMAEHTKQPEVLRELFAALGNDPFIIAECLARPVLAERNLALLPSRNESLDSSLVIAEKEVVKAIPESTAGYKPPTIADGAGCIDDTWTATSIQPPVAVLSHCSVDWQRNDYLGRLTRRLSIQHWCQVHSKHGHLDSNQPDQRT
jgi:hypothetical protein